MIYLKLFLTFLEIGLLSFGGGYAAVPLLESAVVEGNGWLTQAAFSDLVSIAEMTPGPIGINAATFVGVRVAGIGGAVCASLGFIVPSVVIVSLLFFLYAKYRTLPFLQRAFPMLILRPTERQVGLPCSTTRNVPSCCVCVCAA